MSDVKKNFKSFEFEAIGTHWQIDIEDTDNSDIKEKIFARIAEFDKNYSRFRDDSLVAKMANGAGVFELPLDARPMLDLYEELYRITGGLLTPLIGQTISDAGYDAKYSLTEKPMSPPPRWEEVLEYSFPKITLKKPAILDFGALGKGYLIDIISELIEKEGFSSFVVDAGGDMMHKNPEGAFLRVGLEDPEDEKRVLGVALVSNHALCGSAGNRRAWGRFHHILNPETLESPRHILATWTTAKTALLADAMATSLFFVPRQTLVPHFEFESIVLNRNRTIEASEKFQVELFV